jgi:hypothetical protein
MHLDCLSKDAANGMSSPPNDRRIRASITTQSGDR